MPKIVPMPKTKPVFNSWVDKAVCRLPVNVRRYRLLQNDRILGKSPNIRDKFYFHVLKLAGRQICPLTDTGLSKFRKPLNFKKIAFTRLRRAGFQVGERKYPSSFFRHISAKMRNLQHPHERDAKAFCYFFAHKKYVII